jgi:hypothetical protein
MEFLFLSLEQVCIALGAGSAFIFSSFFILSVKDHIVKPHEYIMLKSLSLFSLISACIGIVTFVINSAIYLESAADFRIGLISAKLIIFSLALVTEMTLRKIHLPNLMRHQKTYFHLSDTMVHHPDPLIATASFSMVSWIFIIFLSTLEFRQMTQYVHLSFLEIILAYIVSAYILSKLAVAFKEWTLVKVAK